MKYFFIAAILFLTMSCNHVEKHMDQIADSLAAKTDSTNADSAVIAATPAITSDHYAGTLPCADCTGIETEITLTSDHTYSVHSIYTGRKSTGPGSNEISETGMWMLHGSRYDSFGRQEKWSIQVCSHRFITGAAGYEWKKDNR